MSSRGAGRSQRKCGNVAIVPDASDNQQSWLYHTSCERMDDVVNQISHFRLAGGPERSDNSRQVQGHLETPGEGLLLNGRVRIRSANEAFQRYQTRREFALKLISLNSVSFARIFGCAFFLLLTESAALAQVPWTATGNEVTVWLTDAQYRAARATGSVRLQPDSVGNTGFCRGPFTHMGYGTSTPDPKGPRLNVVKCQFTSRPPRDCRDLRGNWQNAVPGLGGSTWAIEGAAGGPYRAKESGMGNATAKSVTLTGTTLRIEFKTGGVEGYYQWTLDARCQTSTTGTLVFTRGRTGTFKSTLKR